MAGIITVPWHYRWQFKEVHFLFLAWKFGYSSLWLKDIKQNERSEFTWNLVWNSINMTGINQSAWLLITMCICWCRSGQSIYTTQKWRVLWDLMDVDTPRNLFKNTFSAMFVDQTKHCRESRQMLKKIKQWNNGRKGGNKKHNSWIMNTSWTRVQSLQKPDMSIGNNASWTPENNCKLLWIRTSVKCLKHKWWKPCVEKQQPCWLSVSLYILMKQFDEFPTSDHLPPRVKPPPPLTWPGVKGPGVKPTTGHWVTTERPSHVFWLMDATLVVTYVTSNAKAFVLLVTSAQLLVSNPIKATVNTVLWLYIW